MKLLDRKIIEKWREEIAGYTNNETGVFVSIEDIIPKFLDKSFGIKETEDFMSKHTIVELDESKKKEIQREKRINLAKIEVKCPYCNEPFSNEESALTPPSNIDLLTMDGIECLKCKKAFEVDYVPVGIYEVGEVKTEDENKEEEEEKDYAITHKPFYNIGPLRSHFYFIKHSKNFVNKEDKDDYIEFLRVESTIDDESYVVIMEATPNEYPKFTISSYIGDGTGLVIFDSRDDDMSNYEDMDQLEEECTNEYIKFKTHMRSMEEPREM